MAATRLSRGAGRRAHIGLAAALSTLAMAPATVLAQSITVLDPDPAVIFDGNVIELDAFIGLDPVSVVISLPDGMKLVSLRDDAGLVSPSFGTAELAACRTAGGVASCQVPTTDPLGPTISLGSGTNPLPPYPVEQQIKVNGGLGTSWTTRHFYVGVRLALPLPVCAGPVVQVTTSTVVGYGTYSNDAALCTSPVTTTGVTLAPVGTASLVAARGGAPLEVEVHAITSAGDERPVNEALFDPATWARLLQCRRAAVDSAAGPCGSGTFPAFATLTALGESPARFRIAAVNAPDPVPGDADLTLTLGGAAPATSVATVAVEQPVAPGGLVLAARPAASLSAPGALGLGVARASNASGGNEPRTATWSVASVAPAAYDSTARSWVDTAAGTVTVPSMPPEVVTVGVTGTHQNPDGSSTSARLDVLVGTPPTCSLAVDPPTVGPGASASLRVTRSDGASLAALSSTWSVESGGGTVTPDPADPSRATFVAPATASSASVRVELAGGLCPESALTAQVSVAEDLRLRWELARRRVASGEVVTGRLVVESLAGAPLSGLGLAVVPGPSLAVAERVPRAGPGTTVTAAARSARQSSLAVDLDGTSEHTLDFAFLARAGGGCGPTEVAAELRRDASGAVIATARARVEVECEHELSDATLVGRVFDDTSGDGVQQEDEPGIPGALVASATGIYAITDVRGDYHLAWLAAGRHTVKIDVGSLPPGARVADPRREVTLTPGGFTRVSFAVRLASLRLPAPLALDTGASGVRPAAGGLVYRARLRLPVEGELGATRGDAVVRASPDGPGAAVLELPLDAGGGHWLVSLRAPDGRLWLWALAVQAYPRAHGGMLVVPWGPRALAGLTLPPAAASPGSLAVTVELGEPMPLRLDAAGGHCEVERAGRSPCELPASPAGRLRVAIDPPPDGAGDDPPLLAMDVELAPAAPRHFVVGRASVEVDRLGVGEEPLVGGGGAFFYRGTLAGGALVTAGADLPARELLLDRDGGWTSGATFLGRLLGHDPRRVFRDLDPEVYYPTYGDASVTVDEREAGGRLFARVQSGQSFAKWGGVNTAIADAEYGQYVRSLYGFGAQLVLDDPASSMGVSVRAFGAHPDTIAARDELVVTGGSMYFLSHRDVVTGSVRASLEILDEVSGLPVRTLPLVEGADFEADYLGGHLTLDPAVPGRSLTGSLTAPGAGGTRGRLLVDYEYYPGASPGEDLSAGARATVRLGPMTLGATAVGELGTLRDLVDLGALPYGLAGATARLDLGAPLRLRLEVAASEGDSHVGTRSYDGGLTFESSPAPASPSGLAAAVEATSTVAGVTATAYGRWVEPGFTDSRTSLGQRLRQAGARAAAEPWSRGRVWAQLDHRQLELDGGPGSTRDLALAGAAQAVGIFDAAVEGRLVSGADYPEAVGVAAAELGVRPVPASRLALRRRQVLRGEGPGAESATSASVSYEAAEGWTAAVEAGMTDDQRAFGRLRGTVPLVDGTELYATYVASARLAETPGVVVDPLDARGDSLLVGGRRRVGDGATLYSEQRWSVDGAERRLSRTVGAETLLGRRLGLLVAYERATLGAEERAPSLVRDAGSVGTTYRDETVALGLGVDLRHDDGPLGTDTQLGAHGRLDLRLGDALTLAAGGRGASTWSEGLEPGRESWEASAGFAYRPPRSERVMAFGRYALRQDRVGATASDPRTRELSHLGALAVLVSVARPLDVGPKLYYRHTTLVRGPDTTVDEAWLAALRADWHLAGSLDASAEGRTCASPTAAGPRAYGALVEASLLVLEWMRLGAGYNLSSISTDGVRCDEPGARGLYVRAEIVY